MLHYCMYTNNSTKQYHILCNTKNGRTNDGFKFGEGRAKIHKLLFLVNKIFSGRSFGWSLKKTKSLQLRGRKRKVLNRGGGRRDKCLTNY